MDKRHYSTEAIILSRKNFGEADRILTVFSRTYGKLRVIAKGIRRPTSRKRGSLEVFSHTKITLATGKNLDLITETEIINTFSSWRKDLTKVAVAYHLCEVINRLTAEHQEHKEIFKEVKSIFSTLNQIDYWQLYPLTQNFKAFVLGELGFLEKGKRTPKNLDRYIEDLTNNSLHTRKFLKSF